MTEAEVVALMKSSKSELEWDENCIIVRACCEGRYPGFWFGAIILSGVIREVTASWGQPEKADISIINGKIK